MFEFAVLASLRASQLVRGCSPRVDGIHTVAITAQLEIAGGMIAGLPIEAVAIRTPDGDVSGPPNQQ